MKLHTSIEKQIMSEEERERDEFSLFWTPNDHWQYDDTLHVQSKNAKKRVIRRGEMTWQAKKPAVTSQSHDGCIRESVDDLLRRV